MQKLINCDLGIVLFLLLQKTGCICFAGNNALHQIFRNYIGLFAHHGQQDLMADQGYFSGKTMGIFIDLFDGFWREPGLIFSTYSGQPVFNKTLGVSKGQGSDFEIKCNTILKIGIFMDDIAHFRLAEHDQLQQFIIIGLKI